MSYFEIPLDQFRGFKTRLEVLLSRQSEFIYQQERKILKYHIHSIGKNRIVLINGNVKKVLNRK